MTTETAVIKALIEEIENQLTLNSQTNFKVRRSSQPTEQFIGASSGAEKRQIFVEPVSRARTGEGYTNTLNANNKFDREYKHYKDLTIQVSALVDFDETDLNDMPASEFITMIYDLLIHRDSIENLNEKGANFISRTPVRPAFWVNGMDKYESRPSFDITFQYTTTYTKEIDRVNEVRGRVELVQGS